MGFHVSRRHFLLTSAAVPTAASLAGAASAGAPATPAVRVDTHPTFDRAGRAHGVPPALLAALSYAQTRWQDHDGRPSSSLGYGPMHLVDGAAAARAARARAGKDDAARRGRHARRCRPRRRHRARRRAPRPRRQHPRRGGAAGPATSRDAGRPVGVRHRPGRLVRDRRRRQRRWSPRRSQLDLADAVMRHPAQRAAASSWPTARGSSLPAHGKVVRPDAPARPRCARAPREARRHQHRARPGRGAARARRRVDPRAATSSTARSRPTTATTTSPSGRARPRSPTSSSTTPRASGTTVLDLVQDPTYVSWQYSLRSADGHIAQHVLAKDVALARRQLVGQHALDRPRARGLRRRGRARGTPSRCTAPRRQLVRWLARRSTASRSTART